MLNEQEITSVVAEEDLDLEKVDILDLAKTNNDIEFLEEVFSDWRKTFKCHNMSNEERDWTIQKFIEEVLKKDKNLLMADEGVDFHNILADGGSIYSGDDIDELFLENQAYQEMIMYLTKPSICKSGAKNDETNGEED